MHQLFGTAYLRLQADPIYQEIVCQNIRDFDTHLPMSRLAKNPTMFVLEETEQKIAQELACESCCLFSSGYLSGVAIQKLITQYTKQHNFGLFISQTSHPCVSIEGMSQDETTILEEYANRLIKGVAVFDSLNSFFGELNPVFQSVLAKNVSLLAVDISHTFGLWDHPQIFSEHYQHDKEILFFGSLAKAVAFPAGFVAGPQRFIDELRKSPEYCAASPPSPAFANSFLLSESLRKQKQVDLFNLLSFADEQLELNRGPLTKSPIYNLGTDNKALYLALKDEGYELSFLPYPSPTSPSQLRLVLNASLKKTELETILNCLSTYKARPKELKKSPIHWICAD